MPLNYTNEDIYLVSYPKSGNTWLRFLVANAIRVYYDIPREVNFFSIHDIIPDVQISRNILPHGPFGRTDIPRIIKSHGAYNPGYHRVVLLLRDPRDVVVSYYFYLKNYRHISEDYTLSEFVRNKDIGVAGWLKHTQSWLQADGTDKAGHIVQFFFYEDLKHDPAGQLGRIMDLIGLSMSPEDLAKAVELSSKDNMKASEMKHMSTQLLRKQKTPFVRSASVNRGEELSPEDRAYIEGLVRGTVEMVGMKDF